MNPGRFRDPVAGYLYEPFGSERTVSPPNPSTPDNPMRFTGEYLDPTGLYHLRARQYDETNGRFLSVDPLAPHIMEAYVSRYLYANDKPTILVDPTGLRACNIPGYMDTNLTILIVSFGSYDDACGDTHAYAGIALGLGYSVTFAPDQFISCDSTQVQGFTHHFVGGGGGRGSHPGGQEGWFGEVGFGTPGGSISRNWVFDCEDV